MTDAEGRFAFSDYPTCARGSVECRVRSIWVEKAGYETRWESLDNDYIGTTPGLISTEWRWHSDYRQMTLGQVWPPDPQFDRLRREVPAIEPLWLVLWRQDQWPGGPKDSGFYGANIMGVLASRSTAVWHVGRTVAHEYCHAHQDWVIDPADASSLSRWPDTPEGRAFIAAEAADRAAGNWISSRESYVERGATICEYFYYEIISPPGEPEWVVDRAVLRERSPHQYAWAAEWLQGFGGFQAPATLQFRRGGG